MFIMTSCGITMRSTKDFCRFNWITALDRSIDLLEKMSSILLLYLKKNRRTGNTWINMWMKIWMCTMNNDPKPIKNCSNSTETDKFAKFQNNSYTNWNLRTLDVSGWGLLEIISWQLAQGKKQLSSRSLILPMVSMLWVWEDTEVWFIIWQWLPITSTWLQLDQTILSG